MESYNPDHFSLYVIEALKDPQVKAQLNISIDLEFISKHVQNQLQEKLTSLESKITEKDKLITDLKKQNSDLQLRVVELEQYSRKNCLKIEGIEERADEDSFDTVMDLAQSLELDPPLQIEDIDNCHRVGNPNQDGRPRPIIAKFRTYTVRRRFYDSRKLLKKHNQFVKDESSLPANSTVNEDPLLPVPRRPGSKVHLRNSVDDLTSANDQTTADNDEQTNTDEQTDAQPSFTMVTKWRIYINEALCKSRSNLLYQARKLKRENKILDAWTFDGHVKIKDMHNRIKSIDKLSDLYQY